METWELAFKSVFPVIHRDIERGMASSNEVWLKDIFRQGFEAANNHLIQHNPSIGFGQV